MPSSHGLTTRADQARCQCDVGPPGRCEIWRDL